MWLVQQPNEASLSLGTVTWRALRRRCPSCGDKGISRHVAHCDVRCPHCGFDLEHHPGSFIGGIGVNTVLAFAALLLVIVVGFVLTKGDASVVRILVPALAVSVLVPLLLHARSRLFWAGCELVFMPPQPAGS